MNRPTDTAPKSSSQRHAARSTELRPSPLLDVIGARRLDHLDGDHFRADPLVEEPYSLYGGQVTAQALWAAGLTAPAGRHPHSLHAYFLRAGDTALPVDFHVHRDRDGRTYSARRVVASQDGTPILTLSASFQASAVGHVFSRTDAHACPAPVVGPPQKSAIYPLPRLDLVEWRLPDPVLHHPVMESPSRLWARVREPLPHDHLTRACVLAYLSDASTGLYLLERGGPGSAVTLDHAVWFHRPAQWEEFVLLDLLPVSISEGRGLYRGAMYAEDGRLLASLAQESLFRPPA